MKKTIATVTSIILLFCISFQSVSSGLTAISVGEGVSVKQFAQEASKMLREFALPDFAEGAGRLGADSIDVLQRDDGNDFTLSRLIVKSRSKIDLLDSVSHIHGEDGIWVLQFGSPVAAAQAYDYYSERAGVEYVETDRMVSSIDIPETVATEEEPLIAPPEEQFEKDYLSWGPSYIEIDRLNSQLSREHINLTKTVVGVIDTGADHTHPYFKGRVEETNINTSTSGTRNSSMDDNGHGTQVSGVIIDSTLDPVIVRPYKVLDNFGNGTFISVAAGINCAVKDKVDVINISLGYYEDSQFLRSAIDNAYLNDITIISSAGNDATDAPLYPSSYDCVIRVSAVNNNSVPANFTNYGDIDFAAPGVSVKTTVLGGGFRLVSGTSIAAPFVTAIAATMHSADPNITPEDTMNVLEKNANVASLYAGDSRIGKGMVCAPEPPSAEKEKTAKPQFSEDERIRTSEFEVEITCETPGAEIYYTLDRSLPSKNNPSAIRYDGKPVKVTESGYLIAVAYKEGCYRSSLSLLSYIIAPVVPENELSVDSGGRITGYSGNRKSMTIPDKVNGVTVTSVGDNVFADSGLKSIILPDGVVSLGEGSFKDNSDLRLVIARGVKKVAPYAFSNCVSLEHILIENLEKIGEHAFRNVCRDAYLLDEQSFSLNLSGVREVPAFAFEGSAISSVNLNYVDRIGEHAFGNCDALISFNAAVALDLSNRVFENCKYLKSVNIGELSYIPQAAFIGCSGLEQVSIPNAFYVGAQAFKDCIALDELSLDKAETVYSNAFSGCSSLLDIYLPSMTEFESNLYTYGGYPDFSKNLRMFIAPKLRRTVADMFKTCPKISVVSLNSATQIAPYTFRGCNNIYILNIQNVTTLSKNALSGCSISFVDARSLVSTESLPQNSGILLSNNFVEANETASNLKIYGTANTFVERYANYKGYDFVEIPIIVNELPDFITANSEQVYVSAVGFNLSYQWYWNTECSTQGGTPIKGATSASYTFDPNDDAPYYYCLITQDDLGVVTTIASKVITKDSSPADFTEYNEAVAKAALLDRSIYYDLSELDELLSVDVSKCYSCEQHKVDEQTAAILNAIEKIKRSNRVQFIKLHASETDLKLLNGVKILYDMNPSTAAYRDIVWTTDKPDVLIVSENGYVRCIGNGEATITMTVINMDGSIVSDTITFTCDLTFFEKFLSVFVKMYYITTWIFSEIGHIKFPMPGSEG